MRGGAVCEFMVGTEARWEVKVGSSGWEPELRRFPGLLLGLRRGGLHSYSCSIPINVRSPRSPAPNMGCDLGFPSHRGCCWKLAKRKNLLPAVSCL